ncbi:hypothetical protein CEP53_015439, partial [Fusarium sp. AF-6]
MTTGRINQACSAALGNPLSPSKFPRASFRRTDAPEGGAAWGPQEEDSARSFYHCGVRHAWLPPVARASGVTSGQPSTEPIRQRSGRAPSAAGWALWTAGRWSRLKPEQREATTRGGHRN